MRAHSVWLGAMAIVALSVAAVAAVDEEAVALNGNTGWVRDLGESEEVPPTLLSSSTSFAGTTKSVTSSYSLNLGGAKSGLEELEGEKLMGESSDSEKGAARVDFESLQQGLESASDMAGRVSRMAAVKIIMSMPVTSEPTTLNLVQLDMGTAWGRRRQGSAWEKKNNKLLNAKKPAPPRKVVQKVVKTVKQKRKKGLSNALDRARKMAEKAVNMAREKSDKARKKAAAEAAAAAKEASDKKALELAEKRKHELTQKDEKRREKQMKEQSAKGEKKAKEAAAKAAELRAAVKRADEASKKEQTVERKAKVHLAKKTAVAHMLPIHTAKEKAAKRIKEQAMKRAAEVKAKFAGELLPKQQKEKRLKADHETKKKKATERVGKRVKELARKNAEEAKKKNAEETALKKKEERRRKRVLERTAKHEKSNKLSAAKELKMKTTREKSLKAAAARRIRSEKRKKAEKRKAVLDAMEVQKKKMEEVEQKAVAEKKEKLKAEGLQKKAAEKREKKVREATQKKAKEIARKTTAELTGKVVSEQQAKRYAEKRHKEKKKKAEEKIAKMLAGLKSYKEKVAKVKAKLKERTSKYNPFIPREKKLKQVSNNLSKIAKELARKIKGGGPPKKKKKKNGVCNVADNLTRLKRKGILSGKQGKCSVQCTLKPSDTGLQATCDMSGGKKCKKFLYVRSQSVASAIMSEFDAFKQCRPGKPKKSLGEAAMPPPMEEGVEVGGYMVSLKSKQDENGTVDAGDAIDMLMNGDKDSDELGSSRMELGKEEYFNKLPAKCKTDAVQGSLKAIQAQPSPKCQIKCQAGKVSFASYTAECTGSGLQGCFISASEQYQRQVIASYYTWKANCAKFH